MTWCNKKKGDHCCVPPNEVKSLMKRTLQQNDNNDGNHQQHDHHHYDSVDSSGEDVVLLHPSSSENNHLPSSWSVVVDSNIPRLSCAFLASLTTGGTTYAFGLYGATLKQSLHLSQGELDTISSANFCAGLLSWVPGLCVDHFGPRFAMSLGGMTGSLSLILYWAVARQLFHISHNWIVFFLSLLGVTTFLSSALVTGSVFKIIVTSTGKGTKGSAVGVAKGYVGLGAGVYATLFQRIRYQSESELDFLPMAAFFALFASSLPALILLPGREHFHGSGIRIKVADVATPLHFMSLYASLAALALLVGFNSIMQLGEKHPEIHSGRNYPVALLVMAAWFVPILSLMLLPQGNSNSESHEPSLPRTESSSDENDEEVRMIDPNSNNVVRSEEESQYGLTNFNNDYSRVNSVDTECSDIINNNNVIISNMSDEPVATTQQEHNPLQMLQTLPAWFFLWTATILVGSGTVMTNNVGQMVEALHFPAVVAPSSLALFSVAQAASRVATGAVSEAAMHGKFRLLGGNGLSRPVFLIVASLACAVSHAILGWTAREDLFVLGVAMSGAAFGCIWPLMVLVIGEVFGSAHVGANYLFYDGFTSAAGTLLLSKYVAQHVYDSHIHGGGMTCYGTGCFSLSHYIVAGFALTSIISSIGVLMTTRGVYRSMRSS